MIFKDRAITATITSVSFVDHCITGVGPLDMSRYDSVIPGDPFTGGDSAVTAEDGRKPSDRQYADGSEEGEH